jgi:hypothetical protein
MWTTLLHSIRIRLAVAIKFGLIITTDPSAQRSAPKTSLPTLRFSHSQAIQTSAA